MEDISAFAFFEMMRVIQVWLEIILWLIYETTFLIGIARLNSHDKAWSYKKKKHKKVNGYWKSP